MSGDIHNMTDKIACHEKSNTHINAASIHGRWKSGKTIDKDSEMLTKNNILLWTKVLRRLLSIILTMCSLILASGGHGETFHDGVCDEYDEVLAGVVSSNTRY